MDILYFHDDKNIKKGLRRKEVMTKRKITGPEMTKSNTKRTKFLRQDTNFNIKPEQSNFLTVHSFYE